MPKETEPTRRSLREIPEVDFSKAKRLPRGKYVEKARRSFVVEDERRAECHPRGLELGRGGHPVHRFASERPDALTAGFSCRRDRFRTYDPYRAKTRSRSISGISYVTTLILSNS
jgi:hypothetical protein